MIAKESFYVLAGCAPLARLVCLNPPAHLFDPLYPAFAAWSEIMDAKIKIVEQTPSQAEKYAMAFLGGLLSLARMASLASRMSAAIVSKAAMVCDRGAFGTWRNWNLSKLRG